LFRVIVASSHFKFVHWLALSPIHPPLGDFRLLGTPGNLELRKRTGVARMTINNVGLMDLVRDVDVGVTCDMTSHDALCTDHVRGSIRRDPRADLWRDFVVPPCPWAFGVRREELFILCLVEFHDKRFDHSSMQVTSPCTMTCSSVEKVYSIEVTFSCLVREKFRGS